MSNAWDRYETDKVEFKVTKEARKARVASEQGWSATTSRSVLVKDTEISPSLTLLSVFGRVIEVLAQVNAAHLSR